VSAEVPVELLPLLLPPPPHAASPISAAKSATAANALHCRLRTGAPNANRHASAIAEARASKPPPAGPRPGKCINSDDAIVLTVIVEVALVAVAESVTGLVPTAHAGMFVSVESVPATVQLSATEPAKPFVAETVTVEVAEDPGETVEGLAAAAETVKPAVVTPPGQLLTRLATLTVPMPVAKSQPVPVP
jgi:hypothetical protein